MPCNISNEPLNLDCIREVVTEVRQGTINVMTVRKVLRSVDSVLATFSNESRPVRPDVFAAAATSSDSPMAMDSLIEQIEHNIDRIDTAGDQPLAAPGAFGTAGAIPPVLVSLLFELLQQVLTRWLTR